MSSTTVAQPKAPAAKPASKQLAKAASADDAPKPVPGKAAKPTKSTKSVEPEPAADQGAAPTPVDEQPSAEPQPVGDASDSKPAEVPLADRINADISNAIETLGNVESSFTTSIKDLKNKLKNLQKDMSKYQRIVASMTKRPKRTAKAGDGSVKRISGFQKPTGISDQLADFLNISRGTQLPRMDVTRKIHEYIKDNKLQDPTDRRKILPDAKLHALFGTTPETVVNYFNYQGFLKGHFINTPPPASA
ncbi:hypothetical protein HYH03_015936 [Edaphochlamys debaryana]|uniref:DM2 domain-containing protein n=1 Tax=Edaphochlamys debaryana TaxID=47281 RepID=A0A835XL06_9CHLO|nr:hypothetical protein HYH03_015936 [Edaphochlamys debaryana]|eukprot:KAG2485355.1 hypothetical protein HYH03_015936 [Edaphochlamys debaryana]